MALLEKSAEAMLGLKTYQADCATTLFYPPREGKPAREKRERARLVAAKPNKMHYESWELSRDAKTGRWSRPLGEFGITFVCDGKIDWKQFGGTFRTDRFTQPNMLHTILEPWGGFYAADSSPHGMLAESRREGELLELRRAGEEAVDGAPCDRVFAHVKTSYNGETQEYWETWSVARDGLVRRQVTRIEFGGKPGYTRDAVIRNIRINRPLVADAFTYAPPKGVLSEAEYERRLPSLLAAGAAAPDFTGLDAQNRQVRLRITRARWSWWTSGRAGAAPVWPPCPTPRRSPRSCKPRGCRSFCSLWTTPRIGPPLSRGQRTRGRRSLPSPSFTSLPRTT